MSNSSRNLYFDFLRGFAIVMVVGIHTMTNTQPGLNTLEGICTAVFRLLLNCAVPLFLAISGFFLGSKRLDSNKDHLIFLKKQVPKVYIPCLVFSLPYLVFTLFSGENGYLKPIIEYFVCGFSIYYFVALIIQYYTLLPILNKFNNMRGMILTALISTVSILLITYLQKMLALNLPLLFYAGPFPLWIFFFFMGVYFSKRRRDYKIINPIILSIIGLIMQVLEYQFWLGRGNFALGIKLSSFIFSAGIIWLLFSEKIEKRHTPNIIVKAISWIGGISFGIYLLHCYVIITVNKFIPYTSWIEKWILVLGFSISLIWIVKKITPEISIKYLGFR